jgi:hypothetical protein
MPHRTPAPPPLLVALALAAGAAAPGCVAEMDLGEEIGAAEQPLYGNLLDLWPNHGASRVDVDVCWENPLSAPGYTPAAKAGWRDSVRAAIEASWGRYARINFYGWDGLAPVAAPSSCTAGAPGIHVRICSLPSDPACPALPASQSLGGYPGVNGVSNGVRLNPTHDSWVWVHEFGHALGWYHEEERPGQASCDPQSYPNLLPLLYGAYDPTSVMSYCNPSPNPIGYPWLSPNDIASTQRAYGRRIPGSIVSPRAHCVSSHYAGGVGEPAFLWDCDEAGDDQEFKSHWSSGDRFHLELFGPSGGRCLGAAAATSGAQVKLVSCTSSSNWYFRDMSLRGFGGLCLDVQNGSTASGTPIQVWTCGALGGANQRWRRRAGGLLEFAATGKCARLQNGLLVLASCNTADSAQVFNLSDGTIRPDANSGKCLDVQGPSDAQYTSGQGLPTAGARVQAYTCNGSMNQKWNFAGQLRYGPNQALCLDRASDSAGAPLTVATCSSASTTQLWDYYFNL